MVTITAYNSYASGLVITSDAMGYTQPIFGASLDIVEYAQSDQGDGTTH